MEELEFLSDLRVELVAVAERHSLPSHQYGAELGEPAVRAATARHSSPSGIRLARRSRRRLVYALTACSSAAAAAVIAAALLSGGGGSHHPSPTSGGTGAFGRSGLSMGRLPVPIGSNPLPGGRSVSLRQASRLLGATVPTPTTPLANPSNLSVVWGTHGEVTLDYVATQIRISIEPANRTLRKDAEGAFTKMADELHMSPGFLTINGDPSLAVDGGPHNPGFAQVVRHGLSIVVMGHRSAAQLIDIARSLSNTETET
jgi:hypothetical protein